MSEYITEWQYDKTVGMLPHGKMREPIVRCRDCKHYIAWMKGAKPECWANGEPFSVEPDGFCAWGERRQP